MQKTDRADNKMLAVLKCMKWKSEILLRQYRSAAHAHEFSFDPLRTPWRMRFTTIPELSFGSEQVASFTVKAVYDTVQLHARGAWAPFQPTSDVEVADANLLAFEFIVIEHGLAVGIVTNRVTDRAAWRQLFDVHDGNSVRITHVDTLSSEWDARIFRPPQSLTYPNSVDLDGGTLRLDDDLSAVIAFDGYSAKSPCSVHRHVFRVSVEEDSPPAAAETIPDSTDEYRDASRNLVSVQTDRSSHDTATNAWEGRAPPHPDSPVHAMDDEESPVLPMPSASTAPPRADDNPMFQSLAIAGSSTDPPPGWRKKIRDLPQRPKCKSELCSKRAGHVGGCNKALRCGLSPYCSLKSGHTIPCNNKRRKKQFPDEDDDLFSF